MSEAVTVTENATEQWHEVSHLDDLWEGEMTAVEVEGKSVLLVNMDGDVFAYQNRCPHQEWPLEDGDLEGRKLTCAQHLWEFDVCTAKGINPSTSTLVGYECKVDDDGAISVRVR